MNEFQTKQTEKVRRNVLVFIPIARAVVVGGKCLGT